MSAKSRRNGWMIERAKPGHFGFRRFTLIELLVVIAIIGILASMLLPSLNEARKSARKSLCITQLKQHGLAHAMYANDFEGCFPDFGGGLQDLPGSAYGSAQLRMGKYVTTHGGTMYFEKYIEAPKGTPQYDKAPVLYCPGIKWEYRVQNYPGYYVMDNRTYLHFESTLGSGTLGYFFYTGRKMQFSTHSNADTRLRRNDPAELLVTDPCGASDRDEIGASNSYIRKNNWVLSPHFSEDCQPVKVGTANQLTADGAVATFHLSTATQMVMWGTRNYAYGRLINKPTSNGYYVSKHY